MRTVRMAALMAYTLMEVRGVDLPDIRAWTLVRGKDAKRHRVCIFVLRVVVRVFLLAYGVASCLSCASYACSAFCTFDSVTAFGRAFPYFSRSGRSACSADELGGVAVAVFGV